MVSAIVPAYNEENTIGNVISVLKNAGIDEIIVVDDGSKDNTAKVAKEMGVKVLRRKKRAGKGAAMKTGLKEAKDDVILFIDADLMGIEPKKIQKLVQPVLSGEADFVKSYGYFNVDKDLEERSVNVTQKVINPMFKAFFPEVNIVDPLCGQFCAKKDFMNKIDIPDDYGADVSILLDAYMSKLKIQQQNLGYVRHNLSKNPADEKERKQEMADQVSGAIKRKVGIE